MIAFNTLDWLALALLLGALALAAAMLYQCLRPIRRRPTFVTGVDVGRVKMDRAARGYDPDARVYPHPWEGKQARLLKGHPELGIEPGTVGRIKFVYVDDYTELHIAIDGQKHPVVMFEHEAGRYFEVLP